LAARYNARAGGGGICENLCGFGFGLLKRYATQAALLPLRPSTGLAESVRRAALGAFSVYFFRPSFYHYCFDCHAVISLVIGAARLVYFYYMYIASFVNRQIAY
jgi:hypothetical protein